MKKIIYVIILLFLQTANAQQNFCADSSIRTRYMFSNTGAEFKSSLADTTGYNFFIGEYANKTTLRWDAALMKINFGDSMIWAKKLHSNIDDFHFFNIANAHGNTKIYTGYLSKNGASLTSLLAAKVDDNGNILWLKQYKPNFGTLIGVGGVGTNNVLVTANAVYICGSMADYAGTFNWSFVLKLDLNGNILWNRVIAVNLPKYGGASSWPIIKNGILYIAGVGATTLPNGTTESYPVIIQLNDTDGSHIKSTALKVSQHADIKGINIRSIKQSYIGGLVISGNTIDNSGGLYTSNIYSASFDTALNPLIVKGYQNNSVFGYNSAYSFNNSFQFALIDNEAYNFNNKFFLTFDKDNNVIRSRKFSITANFSNLSYTPISFDDKQNLHFLYQYPNGPVGSPLINEYARISNFAPNGTVGCFGKDTSFLTPFTFNITTQPFTWDVLNSDVLVASDIPYTLDTAVVSKQTVCKIVSYCDTIKINGPSAACVGAPVRYTIRRNSTCLKNTDWSIDTAFANITNLEGDSAITITFKKPFNGYIHAALSDCVVKDSFLIKAVVPAMPPLINRTDSLLCPGKTLLLNANHGYSNYVWQGTVVGQQFTVSNAGVYRVTALDSCGVLKKDSIAITLSDTALTLATLPAVCLYDTAFIKLPGGLQNITWQPTANSLLRGNTIVAYPAQTTLYTVTAQRQTNCPITRQVVVTIISCPQTFYMPNSFTPNNDGLNDKFKPTISQPLSAYRLIIYNRYGQTIFTTTDQYKAWDGTFKGTRQPMGGYIYQCSYRFNNGLGKVANGYFMLIR